MVLQNLIIQPQQALSYIKTTSDANANGGTYVAYIFAHDDARFGTNSDESIIKCGNLTTPSSGSFTVDLGFEPQWLMVKRTRSLSGGSWVIRDIMRGWSKTGFERLFAESSSAEQETSSSDYFPINNNGFGSNTETGLGLIAPMCTWQSAVHTNLQLPQLMCLHLVLFLSIPLFQPDLM